MTSIAGVDDAGRGCILGPLVIAGVLVDEEVIPTLVEAGVKDSKLLVPNRRAELSKIIRKMAERVKVYAVPPSQIDKYVTHGKKFRRLNYLEAITMGKVVKHLDAQVFYIDASDVNPDRFRLDVIRSSGKRARVLSAHHADSLYPVVSAASIIAKVWRDRVIDRLRKVYGNIGSGYPSDPKTIEFLRQWVRSRGTYPNFGRRSWKTWLRILETSNRLQ